MRSHRSRTSIIVVGGALAIASVGYGLGTQAGDGNAIADSATLDGGSQERHLGPGPAFERGAPPGFSALATKLGVDADKLAQAMRDFHESQEGDRRDEFTNKLAKALGISSDKVKSALDGLQQRREDRFAGRLADALGVDADKVKAALAKLKDNGPVPFGDFAQKLADELNLDVSDVRAALIKVRPFHEERRGGRHRDDAAPLRQLATALGVSRADLRAAFRQLQRGAENGWEEHQKELAQFLAKRFNLDVNRVSDALQAAAPQPPLMSPHRPGVPDHPPAI
jgi:biotin operon repressor